MSSLVTQKERSSEPTSYEKEPLKGGGIFLDEFGECPRAMQAKFLRVLQLMRGERPSTCPFRRVVESKERIADVRIRAATNCSLIEEIRENRFREDLHYRLVVITIHLPALRNREGALIAIAEQFLREINEKSFKKSPLIRIVECPPLPNNLLPSGLGM